MKKEIADKWVEALRSGEYTQVVGALRRENGMCCLGVLCDLYSHSEWRPLKTYGRLSFDGAVYHLPASVIEWAGMCSRSGRLPGVQSLAELNDSGATFKEVADCIAAKYEDL